MSHQEPRSPAPALPPPSQGSVGYVHGIQSSESWIAGEHDSRSILDMLLSKHVWRVSVFASQWVRLDFVYGTKRTIKLTGLFAPAVFYVPGQCIVYAEPSDSGGGVFPAAFAYLTATPVNSAGTPQLRKHITGAQAISDHAVRFLALANSTVQLGSGGPAVALTLGQTLPLIAGSSLTAGDGYLEFEL
ncbi:MAG TPA: hypothetical protein VNU28_00935 [Solirubrobacteraceae bacterium]|jgi:hypothetical protein|nr:hypothetical protein [Solirubrobacteraceae bacterium]